MKTILGAILGDFVGSAYEQREIKGFSLPLVTSYSRITDDSIMIFATMDAIINSRSSEDALRDMCGNYPDVGFGSTMWQWLAGEDAFILDSEGNGAAVRVSPIACLPRPWSEIKVLVEQNASTTHTSPEAITGATAFAHAIHLARKDYSRDDIMQTIEDIYGYSLDYDADCLFERFEFITEASVTVPIAIWLGLTARNPGHCLMLGLHIGGDTDTIMSMATAISASFPDASLPEEPVAELKRHLSINYPDIQSLLLSPSF